MAGSAQDDARAEHAATITTALVTYYAALKVDVLDRVEGGAKSLIAAIWSARMADALRKPLVDAGHDIGDLVAAELSDEPAFNHNIVDGYLEATAEDYSVERVDHLRQILDEIAAEADAEVEKAVSERLDEIADQSDTEARALTDKAANFASLEAAKAEGQSTKTWVTGENPRALHAEMEGETVGIGERFSNGLRYPGAPGPPEQTANCNCTMTFGKEG